MILGLCRDPGAGPVARVAQAASCLPLELSLALHLQTLASLHQDNRILQKGPEASGWHICQSLREDTTFSAALLPQGDH